VPLFGAVSAHAAAVRWLSRPLPSRRRADYRQTFRGRCYTAASGQSGLWKMRRLAIISLGFWVGLVALPCHVLPPSPVTTSGQQNDQAPTGPSLQQPRTKLKPEGEAVQSAVSWADCIRGCIAAKMQHQPSIRKPLDCRCSSCVSIFFNAAVLGSWGRGLARKSVTGTWLVNRTCFGSVSWQARDRQLSLVKVRIAIRDGSLSPISPSRWSLGPIRASPKQQEI